MPDNERVYLWPPPWMRDVILDAAELQKAKIIYDDMVGGVTHYLVEMYGITREFSVKIMPESRGRSRVRLEVSCEKEKTPSHTIHRQFALYESLMRDFCGWR